MPVAQMQKSLVDILQDFMWAQRPPLTAAEFARRVGVSHATIYNMLNGVTHPGFSTLKKIAEKTDIPLRDLLEAAGYPVDVEVMGEWDFILGNIPNFTDFDEETRQRFVDRLTQLRIEREKAKEKGSQAS